MGIPSAKEIDYFLGSINLPSLLVSQLQDLNSPFTETEIALPFKTLPNGKSPGPDGYSNEYIKTFQTV